jgi:peptidoglycan/LPS O-acetylase OafA/YrhL
VVVRRWSYLWAGLFGAFYVAWKGMGSRFLLALLINIGFVLAAVAVAGVTSFPFVPKRQQAIALVAMVPIIIGVQGTVMIRLIRDGYRRRGWKVRKDD